MNNQNLMGEYELEGLEEILKGLPDIRDVGFDMADISLMFDDSALMEQLNSKAESVAAKEGIEGLQKIKDFRKSQKNIMHEKNDHAHNVILVFQSNDQVVEFLEKSGLPPGAYQDGRTIAERMGVKLAAAGTPTATTVLCTAEGTGATAAP